MSEIVVTRQVVSSNKDRQPYPMPTLRQSMLKAGGYLLLILLFVWGAKWVRYRLRKKL